MNLIEEIEAAADSAERKSREDHTAAEMAALTLICSEWWLRIKDALRAAEKMDDWLGIYGDMHSCQRDFRNANEGV